MKPKGFLPQTATLKAQKRPSHHPNETALLTYVQMDYNSSFANT